MASWLGYNRRGELALYIYLMIINLVAFFTMWMDKQKARQHKWRIPEKRIWLLAIAGGACGATFGMYMFRHKTQHRTFVIGLPLIIAIQIAVLLYFM
ncbi:DUF1294 domain-containing protein [Gracilibacillus salinarum]|uniref:DUF1294 domain-containing protein n=2 Tax=Gracilibacillus salinarum TaxID=2932255 RepID=A0ABY4GQ45_9BACI|nr:DUF1294 domain-containing protein [Gracilibacillus salinarum]UOQ86250.1 DUF1294 domain-containing protein [Gracilibacillus salinarum]